MLLFLLMMERWKGWRPLSFALRGSRCNKGEDAATFLLPMTPYPGPLNATPEKHGAPVLSRLWYDTYKSLPVLPGFPVWLELAAGNAQKANALSASHCPSNLEGNACKCQRLRHIMPTRPSAKCQRCVVGLNSGFGDG